MGNEWTETTLGQVVEDGGGLIQTGPFGSQLHASDYESEGVPVIMPMNISSDRVDVTDIARISREDADRLSKHLVESGDIVYSRRGDVTRKALITNDESGMFCGTGCLLVRPGENINPKFLKYHLSSPWNLQWIIQHAVGATMPNLNTGILSDIPLRVPTPEMQRAIAHILGTLDDKIELNRRMNETLESMARALFKSWFVDFDAVIDNALAAGNPIPKPLSARAETRRALAGHTKPLSDHIQKLFPDAFHFDEQMGWIPEGWNVQTIGDTIDLSYGKSLPAKKREDGVVPVYGSGGISGWHSESLCEGPGLVVGRKGTVRSLYWVKEDYFPIDTVFFVVNKSEAPLYWIYQSLQLIDIKSMGADSAVPGVNRNAIYGRHFCLPTSEVWNAYWENLKPITDKMNELESESLTLAKLRDTLLPQLLSGELRIADAEQLVADSL